jgi:hypothetical protein
MRTVASSIRMLMSFFQSLQDSRFTDWFLGSASIWTYPTVLTLHTAGLAVLVGASAVMHLRVLDVGATIPFSRLQSLGRLIWGGFTLNLITGLVLFVTQAATRATDPVFYVKLGSIAMALWFGHLVKRRAIDRVDMSLASRARIKWLAGASLALWTTAIVSGRLMAYLSN